MFRSEFPCRFAVFRSRGGVGRNTARFTTARLLAKAQALMKVAMFEQADDGGDSVP